MSARHAARLGVALACLAGCVRLTVPTPHVHEYRIDYPPPQIDGPPLPVVLRIAPFRVAAAYAGDAIVYRSGDFETDSYVYHRWATNPGNMIADLLARDFAASGRYRAVQQGPSLLPSDYVLTATIEEIEERSVATGHSAHLRLRVLLFTSRAPSGEPVWQRIYDVDQPCLGMGVSDFVAAMSRAVEGVSAQVQREVYEAIAERSRDPEVRSQQEVALPTSDS